MIVLTPMPRVKELNIMLIKSNFVSLVLMFTFASFNVNKLRNITRCRNIFALISENHYDMCLLQETYWDDEMAENYKQHWDGKIFYSNAVDQVHCGVAILVNNKYDDVEFVSGSDGRFIHVSFMYNDVKYNVINIYAPNSVTQRSTFFANVSSYIIEHNVANIIMGGDFNTSLSYLDRNNSSVHCTGLAYRSLTAMLDSVQVCDIWRSRNPGDRVFSRKMVVNNILRQSRIDYFLVSVHLRPNVQNIFYRDTTFSDHCIVVMKVDLDMVEKGPGLWILNNLFLTELDYQERVKMLLERDLGCPLYESEMLVWWDNFKYKVKKMSQAYGYRRNRSRNKEFYRIHNQLERYSRLIAEGKTVDMNKYEELRVELQEIEVEKCKGAILRAKAHWAIESDKNTKYFLQLERRKQNSNCIRELVTDTGVTVTDTCSILQEEYRFYSELYSCVETNDGSMHELLNFVDKRVDSDDIVSCDADINLDEVRSALGGMSKGKSPGPDGLTVEFYLQFYDVLQSVLLKLFHTIEVESEMARSMRHGAISLIYKKKGDKSN
jgi:exonuclease III